MKKRETVLREILRTLNEDDLRFMCSRLGQRLQGDLGECVEFIEQYPEFNEFLSQTRGAFDFYDLLDEIQLLAELEYKRRQTYDFVQVSDRNSR